MEKNLIMNFLPQLFSAIFSLSLYFLFYLPLELLLTEFLFIIPKINPYVNAFILFFFLLFANLFDWGKIVHNRKKLIALSLLIAISFSVYGIYRHVKIEREHLPKIYQINLLWIIQGQLIEIRGTNFGATFKKGEVTVDGIKFLVKDWSENKIIAEAPVPDIKGHFYLSIKTKDNKISNQLLIEIKDPDYLKKYLQ